ncbi:MAG: translation initiation factor IF-2 [Deltaproteobacteria bacterium]|jgi:translation initiation factor IF-2|nr:translation initiation factor IF-2 [Deltaproteobacteria bacterium]
MGKTRVYDLAKQLGLENKELLEKLKAAGLEVKSHSSVLDDEDIKKYESFMSSDKTTEEATSVKIEEQRISSGLIRRRRSAAPEKQSAETAEPSAEADEEQAVSKKQEPADDVEKPLKVESDPNVIKQTETKPDQKTAVDLKPESTVKSIKSETTPQQKVTAKKQEPVTAKILGRVDLPSQAVPAERPQRREQPKARPAERPEKPVKVQKPSPPPLTPSPLDAPGSGKEPRGGKKKKKGRNDYGGESDGRQAKRKMREVYEPDRADRYRKSKKSSRPAKKTEITVSKAIKRKIRISDVITVGELAKRMGVKANDLIRELIAQGQMVTINHPLDYESAAILASEFGYEVENVAFDEESILTHTDENLSDDSEGKRLPRPPVVTIMGHVDHGKTSLLDAIRQANVTEGEAGGITQHIGAYDVDLDGRKITFLDTPGHEAFTSMRARGAKVTDIVVVVVAADDGVMPQTKEAINHSRAAEVPIIVAVNKIDKPDANPDRVKQELSELGLLPEEWGGDTIFVDVSAKQHTNIDQLLEMILLQAEVLELTADPDKRAQGTVVEARLDKGRGPVTTVLVQQGTLKIGDPIVAGLHYGRVRSMTDDRGTNVEVAGPSFPVEVTGLSGVPSAGDAFHALEDERSAKEVAQHRQQKLREAELAKSSKISLDQLYARIQEGDVKELRVIVKADVQGSVEAVSESLAKLSTDSCRLLVIHSGVGGITETDISLAAASDAIVLGFNVRPAPKATALAEQEGVDIRLYNVIYDAVNDVKSAMEGLLAPTLEEVDLGRAEVREVFNVSKVGAIAGCYVTEGKILRNAFARLLRDDVVVWSGKLDSLRRFKDDVREVNSGYECGIGLERYNDIKIGDVIEVYEIKETKTKL